MVNSPLSFHRQEFGLNSTGKETHQPQYKVPLNDSRKRPMIY
jgi:hypothetical protein